VVPDKKDRDTRNSYFLLTDRRLSVFFRFCDEHPTRIPCTTDTECYRIVLKTLTKDVRNKQCTSFGATTYTHLVQLDNQYLSILVHKRKKSIKYVRMISKISFPCHRTELCINSILITLTDHSACVYQQYIVDPTL
jgi:hypothetical protein